MLKQAKEISQRIFDLAGKTPIRIFIRSKKGILVRFTNNGVHQNGEQDIFAYAIHPITKNKTVYIESNDTSDEGIKKALTNVCRGGVSPPTNKGRGDLAPTHKENSPAKKLEFFPSACHNKSFLSAADAIEKGLALIRREQASANGYYSSYERYFYLADSSGREFFHPATATRFGVTVTKGAGKGYASFYHPNAKKLRVEEVVQQAAELAREAAREGIILKPGDYECVFSPRAFLEILEPLRRHFDADLCRAGKSVFSKLAGKQIFSKAFTLSDDVRARGQFGVPFDDEGLPKKKVNLIERGFLKKLLSDGHHSSAHLEHPVYPENLVVEKGEFPVAAIFKKIKRGIFINKVWYHSVMRESSMEVTGLATAGSLYIENGAVRGRVANLRYHDSLFSVLRSVLGTSKEQLLLKDSERGAALLPYVWVSRLRVV